MPPWYQGHHVILSNDQQPFFPYFFYSLHRRHLAPTAVLFKFVNVRSPFYSHNGFVTIYHLLCGRRAISFDGLYVLQYIVFT
jgi:hypothetical protein